MLTVRPLKALYSSSIHLFTTYYSNIVTVTFFNPVKAWICYNSPLNAHYEKKKIKCIVLSNEKPPEYTLKTQQHNTEAVYYNSDSCKEGSPPVVSNLRATWKLYKYGQVEFLVGVGKFSRNIVKVKSIFLKV